MKKMILIFFIYFLYLIILYFSFEYLCEMISNKFILGFYILIMSLNLFQTFFLNLKFFLKRTLFYYKSIIIVNIFFLIINIILEYTNYKNILVMSFQILINIFNIIFIIPKKDYIYNEIEDNTISLSSNQDYPEATYL